MGDISVEILATPNTPSGRLRWEQIRIPLLGRKLSAQLLHLTAPTAPLVSGLRTLFSPSDFGAGLGDPSDVTHSSIESTRLVNRLSRSFAQGGMAQVKEVLWPMDLPRPELHGSLVNLPPVVPLDFISRADQQLPSPGRKVYLSDDRYAGLELPESFILYHGPNDRRNLTRLLQAWSWAADPIGANTPLVVIGLEGSAKTIFSELVAEFEIRDNLHLIPDVKPDLLPALYQGCTAVFHPAQASPWCGPVRLALASGKPLIASETPYNEAIAGPAAYLVDEGDARALGAALVTVVVEEQVAESLSAAAVTRATSWISPGFGEQLLLRYRATHRESV
jgi:glycosyltransferase involved in cell wall biosynthesis